MILSNSNNASVNNTLGATVSLAGQNINVEGSLVFSTVSGLLAASNLLLKKIESGSIYVNLSGVDQIDSAGVALLVEWQRYCQQQHKSCQFSGLKAQGVSLIKTYKLLNALRID